MLFRKVLVLLALAILSAAAQAVTIDGFGFTVGKITLSSPTSLLYDGMEATNPPIPLIFSPVTVDTSLWAASGDPVSASPLEITGFDLATQKVTIDYDCIRKQAADLIPTAVTECSVTSILPVGAPTVFGTPVDFDVTHIVLTEQGTIVDAAGMADVPFLATGSGTGVHHVDEPDALGLAVAGMGCLGALFLLRLPSTMKWA